MAAREIGHAGGVVVASAELSVVERCAIALNSMPARTVLSHRSAAALWGLWIPAFDGVEVTTPAGVRGSRYTTSVQREIVVAHRRILPPEDVTEQHGLPVTSLARTWLDLAALVDIYDLVAAGDRALQVGAEKSELAERAVTQRRLRGTTRCRAVAPLLHSGSRSRPESRIRAALLLAGLPMPEVNRPVYDEHGQWLAEPDLHYKAARLAIEFNGSDHATIERMRKDATRTLDLLRADWLVRIYTAIDAFRRLDGVVADNPRDPRAPSARITCRRALPPAHTAVSDESSLNYARTVTGRGGCGRREIARASARARAASDPAQPATAR
jgi:hypothetical protein